MKFIMMLFSIPIYTFFETRVLFNDISFIIRHYFSYIFSIFVVYLLYHIRLIRLSGDIELNPGPKPSSFKCFSICHWNLNSITSHDFLKVKLLTAYNVMHKFDIICISESYLNSGTWSNDDNLNTPGYNRSPNLTMESITQKNSFLTVVFGDFNARSSKWETHDKATQ